MRLKKGGLDLSCWASCTKPDKRGSTFRLAHSVYSRMRSGMGTTLDRTLYTYTKVREGVSGHYSKLSRLSLLTGPYNLQVRQ